MADKRPVSASRGNSARTPGPPKGRQDSLKNNIKKSNHDLLSREEEYKRLNEELESKTANLVREAEEVIRDQERILTTPSMLDNINREDFFASLDDDVGEEDFNDEDIDLPPSQPTSSRPVSSQQVSHRGLSEAPSSTRSASRQTSSRPSSKVSNKGRPISASGAPKKPPRSKSRGRGKSAADDVAVGDDGTFISKYQDFSLQKTISNIEGRLDQGEIFDDDDDVMPLAAAEMGAEAQIRFLKAKLRVMQEELDRLADDCTKKDEENNKLSAKLKELEDERGRLHRTNASQQSQIDKYKKLADDAKSKTDNLESQLASSRKELEAMKRAQKQQHTNQSATEVRLNRALEEAEKYKAQLHKAKSSAKETTDAEKKKVEQLLAENKRLEKQKNELIIGFKKQLKLIDILKRQKMHIEAAKMLSFTEEEFVKALEWGN